MVQVSSVQLKKTSSAHCNVCPLPQAVSFSFHFPPFCSTDSLTHLPSGWLSPHSTPVSALDGCTAHAAHTHCSVRSWQSLEVKVLACYNATVKKKKKKNLQKVKNPRQMTNCWDNGHKLGLSQANYYTQTLDQTHFFKNLLTQTVIFFHQKGCTLNMIHLFMAV